MHVDSLPAPVTYLVRFFGASRSVTHGKAQVWNTEIMHVNGGRVSLAHASGQGIRSETRNGNVANAVYCQAIHKPLLLLDLSESCVLQGSIP